MTRFTAPPWPARVSQVTRRFSRTKHSVTWINLTFSPCTGQRISSFSHWSVQVSFSFTELTRTDRRGAARVNVSLRLADSPGAARLSGTDSVTDWLSFHCASVYCLVEGGWSKNLHSFVLSYLKINQSVNKRRFPNSLSVSVKVIFPMYAAAADDWVVTDDSICFSVAVKFSHIKIPQMIG